MTISAINSVNFNRTAFKGAQSASKTEAAVKPQSHANFFEENKEVLVGLAAIGATALAGFVVHKTGLIDKIFHRKANQVADPVIEKINPNDKAFDGIFGQKGLDKIKNTIEATKVNEQIAEFGPEGTRHAARIESKYEEALPEIFAEDAKVFSREEVLNFAKIAEKVQ